MAEFSQELFDRICERIANGESLRAICADKDMPSKTNVLRWTVQDDALRDQYARAREAQADHFADQIVEIADIEEDPNRARVRIDARKWAAGKMRPKVYGDKVDLTHSAPDGKPLTFTWRNASD